MDGTDFQTTFCHHITRYRAVDTAGDQQHCLAAGSNRNTACTFDLTSMNISCIIAYLYHNDNVRVMHVNFQMRELFEQIFADTCTDLRRLKREALVRTFCLYLKGSRIFQLILQIFCCSLFDQLKIFIDYTGSCQCRNSEYLLQAVNCFIQIISFFIRLNIDGGLSLAEMEGTDRHQFAAGIFDQTILKRMAI